MKPVKLHLKNIGPFLDETIDFTQLKNMFLITGKTGSGKTTIFDAITFALYGSASGRNENFKLKSDYASNDDEAYVDYEFILNCNKYRVVRNIGTTYTGRDGSIKNKQNTMEFYAWDEQNNQYQMFPGKIAELTAKVTELIGLSKDEFTKIVVLPQGAFQAFLKSTSEKKSETLKKLFPIELYSEICKSAQEKAKEVKQKISTKEQILEEKETNFNLEEKQKEADKLQKETENLVQEKNKMQEELQELYSSKEKISQKINLVKKASQLEEQKNQLEENLEEYKLLKTKTENAERAMAVLLYNDSLGEYQFKEKSTQTVLENKSKEKIQLENQLNLLKEKSVKIEELKKNLEEQKRKYSRLDDAMQLNINFTSNKQKLEKSKNQLTQSATTLQELFEASLEKVEDNRAIIETLSQQKDEWLDQEEELEEQKESYLINNSATILSEKLKDNCPCPVCGSLTHPTPAKCTEKKDFDKLIKELRIKIDQTQNNIDKATKEIQSIKETNKNAKDILESSKKFASKNLDTSKVEFSTSIYSQKIMEVSTLISEFTSNEKIAKDWEDQFQKISKELELKEDFSELKNQLETSIKENSKIICDFELQLKNISENFTRVSVEVTEKSELIESLKKEISALESKLKESLVQSKFNDLQEAQQFRMDRNQIEINKQKTEKFFATLDDIKAQLKAIDISTNELEKFNLEFTQLQEKEKQFDLELKNIENSISQNTRYLERINLQMQEINKLKNELQQLQDNNQDVLRLDMDLNGNNSKKISFDSWVMGTFLDEVVEKANLRFSHISGKRYQFVLVTDKESGRGKRGLDLEILDTWTGKSRQTESLSGGETFEASISLALALTDVVQEKSGGVRLDSLFIDEGFGTLDQEVIYKAINILDQVREERTVGIISHVALLQKEIKSHINVNASLQGGPSTISVENF